MRECPFCGSEMHRGQVRMRGWYATMVSAVFNSTDEPGTGSLVLGQTFLRRARRNAHGCPTCEAVLIDPKPQKSPE